MNCGTEQDKTDLNFSARFNPKCSRHRNVKEAMLDLGYCLVMFAFFFVSILYVRWLEKLKGGDRD